MLAKVIWLSCFLWQWKKGGILQACVSAHSPFPSCFSFWNAEVELWDTQKAGQDSEERYKSFNNLLGVGVGDLAAAKGSK